MKFKKRIAGVNDPIFIEVHAKATVNNRKVSPCIMVGPEDDMPDPNTGKELFCPCGSPLYSTAVMMAVSFMDQNGRITAFSDSETEISEPRVNGDKVGSGGPVGE